MKNWVKTMFLSFFGMLAISWFYNGYFLFYIQTLLCFVFFLSYFWIGYPDRVLPESKIWRVRFVRFLAAMVISSFAAFCFFSLRNEIHFSVVHDAKSKLTIVNMEDLSIRMTGVLPDNVPSYYLYAPVGINSGDFTDDNLWVSVVHPGYGKLNIKIDRTTISYVANDTLTIDGCPYSLAELRRLLNPTKELLVKEGIAIQINGYEPGDYRLAKAK